MHVSGFGIDDISLLTYTRLQQYRLLTVIWNYSGFLANFGIFKVKLGNNDMKLSQMKPVDMNAFLIELGCSILILDAFAMLHC